MLEKLRLGATDRRFADQHAEPVGLSLDVVEERQRGLFEQLAGVSGGQRRGDAIQQRSDLPVDDHRVQAFLAAEVFVHDRLGDLRPGGDLLDRGGVEAALGKELPPDRYQLLASLRRGHPDASSCLYRRAACWSLPHHAWSVRRFGHA